MKQTYLILSLAVSVILCSAVQSNAADLADGQIAYYPFNGNAADESGNGHDGTVSGATLTTDRFGNADSAYAFDGINDYIRIGSEPNVSMMTNYAVSVWFLNDGGGSFGNYGQKVLDKTSLYHDFYLAVRNTGALRYHLYEGTSAGVNDSSYDYRDSAWHHAVIQTRANIMSMWVDGVYVGAASNAMPVSSTSDLLIGYTDSSDALQRVFWSGSIDDMRIYNRVLSEQEIQELVNESDSADSGGLIAHYPFNGNADDESGNGHDGTVNGATLTTDRFGNADSAYSFDGQTDLIVVPDHDDLTVSNVTVVAWIRTTDKSDMKHITSCWEPGVSPQWYNMLIRSDSGVGTFQIDPGNYYSTPPRVDGLSDLADGAWHCLVGIRDISELELRLYVDGLLVNTAPDVSTTVLNPAVDFWIGGQNGWPARYFNGDIDDVRIYNRVLSQSEISELAGQDSDSGLVAHYPFNGNADDESGNGYDGTVNGATLAEDRFGNADSAYHFDGINDYIRIGSEPNVSMMTNYAVSVWFLNDGGGSFGNYGQKVLDKTSLYHDFYLAVRNTGALRYHLYEGTSAGVNDSSYDYRDSAWHHAVIQTRANIMSMWVDGVYVGAASNAMPVSSTSDLLIGYTDSSDALQRVFWSGSIDDMRIYNRVLSEQEIQELVNESDSADSGGLIAHYPFNGNAADESGNGHDGAVSGAMLTADRFGNADSAYRFDGADDLVIIPDHTDFTVTDISISAWIRTTDKSEHRHITSCYGTGWNSEWYNLYYRKDTGAAAWQVDPGGINPPTPHTFGSTDVADGEWHLLVGVRDTSSSIVKIYVDGVLQNSGPDISAEALDPEVDFWIGGQNGWPTRFFNGDIDDVSIYNRALSEDEVSTLYSDGLPSAPMLEIYTDVLTNTLVVAGETVSRTMTLTNAGNADLEFEIRGTGGSSPSPILFSDGFEDGNYDGWTEGSGSVSYEVTPATSAEGLYSFSIDGSYGHFRGVSHNLTNMQPEKIEFYVRSADVSRASGYFVVGNNNNAYGNHIILFYMYKGFMKINDSVANVYPCSSGQWYKITFLIDWAAKQFDFLVDDELVRSDFGFRSLSVESLTRVDLYNYMDTKAWWDGIAFNSGSADPEHAFPDWLEIEPPAGTVAPGESMDINLTYTATNRVAGDYAEHVLQLLSNDPDDPEVGIPVSMWVTPSVPELFAEPQCTVGKSNEVAWVVQDGPVEYLAEAEAIQHCTPSSCTDSNAPDGWLNLNSYAENPEDWFKDSGWIDSTSYWFTGLRLNNVYQYRVKASVVTAIGRLESDWSDWTSSAQVPVILDHNGDHVPGWWKRWYFGTEDNFISSMDSDGDQLCDYYEYISGSNPHDARSKFKIGKGKAHQNGDFVVNWDSVTGRVYNVYWSPDVVGPYELLEADIAYPQNSCTDTVHRAESGAFYRIDVSLDN